MTEAERQRILDALADPNIPGWSRLDPQPPPKPGEGDVWLDVIRAMTGPSWWAQMLGTRDRRPDRMVLYVSAHAAGMLDLAILSPETTRSWSWGLVGDMHLRRLQGFERYGVPLQYGNGRRARDDAYQEALDLVAYSWQDKAPWWLRWGAVLLAWAWRRRCTRTPKL